jgi:hypothetical protein
MTLHAYIFVHSYLLLQDLYRDLLALSAMQAEFVEPHRPSQALLSSEWACELWIEARNRL